MLITAGECYSVEDWLVWNKAQTQNVNGRPDFVFFDAVECWCQATNQARRGDSLSLLAQGMRQSCTCWIVVDYWGTSNDMCWLDCSGVHVSNRSETGKRRAGM